jgi:TIR domain
VPAARSAVLCVASGLRCWHLRCGLPCHLDSQLYRSCRQGRHGWRHCRHEGRSGPDAVDTGTRYRSSANRWLRTRRVGDGMAGGTSGYDVFISYSHALDGVVAQALQTGLEQFAKPWYRPRAMQVFRDNTSLSANPGLWSSIEKVLASSAWLMLIASPEAARSPWVDREIAWWIENKSPQRLLVVLTAGAFAWDGDAGHLNGATAALPPRCAAPLTRNPVG